MIIELIFLVLTESLNVLTSFLPGGNSSRMLLPYGIDEILVTGVTGYKYLAQYFPPFDTILSAFLIYLGFRLVLRIIKMIPIVGRSVESN